MNTYSQNNNFYNSNFSLNLNRNNNIKNYFINNMNSANQNNNFVNNQTMNTLLSYINLMKINSNNTNNFLAKNNTNINRTNIMQLIPNLMNLGFNQPYSFENVKKSTKTQSISFDKRKYNYDHIYNPISSKYHLSFQVKFL